MPFRALPALAAAIALVPPAAAVTVVNESGGALELASPVQQTSHTVSDAQHFDIPESWGDSRHLYLDVTTATGLAACSALQDRYGTLKVPSHWSALRVGADGICESLAEVPAAPEPPTPEPPVAPADEEGTHDGTPTPNGDDADPTGQDRGFPPRGNGTWLYDAAFPDGPTGQPHVEPGLWRDELAAYNANATAGHHLDQLFSYGGDLEMECRGGSDCTQDKMHVYYYPPTSQHKSRSLLETGASGFVSTQAYVDTGGDAIVIPIFDGRFDTGGYLQEFETLSENQARTYADIFARTVCADPAIPGVQLDLEPFDIGDPAQAWFYDQLAMDLAGANTELESILRCKTELHPKGRFFSVFTFANQITPELGAIFTRHGNGYVIVSLYDLGPGPATVASDPAAYRGYVADEIARTVSNSIAAGDVPFQLAIPAAASTKEFATYRGTPSGYTQLEYVEQALGALSASQVRENDAFLGIAVWGWSRFMAWPPHTDGVFEPGSPPADVLALLAEQL